MKKLMLLLLLPLAAFAQDPTASMSCDCPKTDCPPCMKSQGLTFYTEKCGDGGSKTRSCSKPTCVPDPLADASQCNKSQSEAATTASSERQPSSTNEAKIVGAVKVLKGKVSMVTADGNTRTVVEGDPVHEHDSLVTGKSGGAMIEFDGGNRVHVLENTRLTVQEYRRDDNIKTAVLNLLKGKIRNQVKEKYDGKNSTYKVVTPGVVAGVRGTDFVVTQEESDHGITRVETLTGKVQLNERTGAETATVDQGYAVTFRMEAEPKSAETDWSDQPRKGVFNPVYKMTNQQLAYLDNTTLLEGHPAAAKRAPKPDPVICQAPAGKLNQCSWTCKNNPKGAKTCETDKAEVTCVRLRCNANGDWTEETRLPASAGSDCDATSTRVDACDY